MDFHRDEKGLVKKATFENGYTVLYEYDKFGRTTAIVYPDGKKINCSYGRYGNLTETVCGNTHTKLNYDDLGRLTERLYEDGSRTCYEYNDFKGRKLRANPKALYGICSYIMKQGANYCLENNMYNSKKIIKNNQNTTNRDIFI